jgi:hypothetical protein
VVPDATWPETPLVIDAGDTPVTAAFVGSTNCASMNCTI